MTLAWSDQNEKISLERPNKIQKLGVDRCISSFLDIQKLLGKFFFFFKVLTEVKPIVLCVGLRVNHQIYFSTSKFENYHRKTMLVGIMPQTLLSNKTYLHFELGLGQRICLKPGGYRNITGAL